ncbi:MAG: YraN family protein [Deltaproteobacteria bacterium]|nr:YraN family protein [Deltaproteobacteria bacterium]MBT4525810.1 YraN family protein [Deltaproteobacteria bacterium]
MTTQQRFKTRKSTGITGEQIATTEMKQKGYQILENNYRCHIGEIDIVASNNEFLVFVEVKTRTEGKTKVDPLISITQKKRRKLKNLGMFYVRQKSIYNKQPRFDVIAIMLLKDKKHTLQHIENAF